LYNGVSFILSVTEFTNSSLLPQVTISHIAFTHHTTASHIRSFAHHIPAPVFWSSVDKSPCCPVSILACACACFSAHSIPAPCKLPSIQLLIYCCFSSSGAVSSAYSAISTSSNPVVSSPASSSLCLVNFHRSNNSFLSIL
jgi:hypothetical protein